MFNKLKQAMEVKTDDEGDTRRMQELFAADLAESKRGDIRSKFDSGFIPGAHKPIEVRPPGVHGWVDNDGVLHPFDPQTPDEIEPRSLDAWQEKRLAQLEASDAQA